jgi:acetoin utilization deacetylase AcuC-like enzyme
MTYGRTGQYDAIFVAAGFDHCIGELFESPTGNNGPKFWTLKQVEELGDTVRLVANMCLVLKHPVSVLEGGYERNTLMSFLPAYAARASSEQKKL